MIAYLINQSLSKVMSFPCIKDFNPIKDAKRIGNNRAEAILEKIDKLVEQIILTDSPLGNHYSLDLSFVADTCKSASIYISALKPEYQLPEKEYVRDFEIIRVDGMSSLSVMLKKLYLKLENHLRETKALYHTEPSKTGDTLAKLTFDVLRHQVKFTRADGTDLWSGEIDYSQPAGTVITAPDWNGKAECGGGLHFANAVRALIYHPKGKGNLISRAFWVHPTGKEISLNSGIRKTESLMVIRELNILEILSGIAQYAYCPSVRQFAEERLRALEVA